MWSMGILQFVFNVFLLCLPIYFATWVVYKLNDLIIKIKNRSLLP